MAEQQTPESIVDMLREFHSRMEDAVFTNKGTLDKFLGDGLMATFGIPEITPDDALNALQCAQAMHNQMRDWNYSRKKEGKPPIRLSVGIHYGKVVMGDIGSERRLEYAVLGDVVNVASRLEASTRELNAYVVISANLVEAAGGEEIVTGMGYVENGCQSIRGRDETIKTWIQPLSDKAAIPLNSQ
ncbi:adenylate/guanylate cyclase domain-containing protein [Sneathiella sp.]|uniref:adenylate/guanylate cyclase domain-containing protein n=1 Tax=Sneathiella sp. TaxID=1964365 RepID=UPI00356B18CE